MQEENEQVYHLKVGSAGRVVLPAGLRERHHINDGDTVVVFDDAKGLRLRTLDEVIKEVQEYFATIVPRDVSLVDEILADRRSEIERD
jgi:AbrB family looped-hinge helix DNA binding protein